MSMFRSLAIRNGTRCCQVGRPIVRASSNNASSPPASSAEIESLRQELKTLQQLMRETNMQSRYAERLARQVEAQTTKMQQNLKEVHTHVLSASALQRVGAAAKDYVHQNNALSSIVEQLGNQVNKHPGLVNKYTIAGLVVLLVIIWRYRALLHEKTSENVADLASRTLQQDTLRRTIQETLDAIATSPDTLATLNGLLQTLIQEPTTQQHLVNLLVYAIGTPQVQNALMKLLQVVFQDPYLQELTGLFLLKGLDVDHVKQMLESQTRALVRETVLDESVQKATATGVQKSLRYAVLPPFLRHKTALPKVAEEAQKAEETQDKEAGQKLEAQ